MVKKAGYFLLILLSITIINGQTVNLGFDELMVLNKTLYNATVYMQKEARYEDVAIFMGTTKSGKSTLINYLIGNPLIAFRERPGKPLRIKKADNSPGPVIGTSATSETKVPSRWTSKNFPNMSFWDSPGLNDNRGLHQDIENAFYRYQLQQKVKSLRTVLVVDIIAIQEDNIINFMDILKALDLLMQKKMIDCFKSISVIFTKAQKYFEGVEVDKTFIKDLLQSNILDRKEIKISPNSRAFVQYLIDNEKYIGIFGRVDKPGNITSDNAIDVIPAIVNSVPMPRNIVKELSIPISIASNAHLTEAREILFSKQNIEDLQIIVAKALHNKVLDYNSMNITQMSKSKINQFKQEVTNLENQLYKAYDNCTHLHEKIEILQEIVPSINDQFEKHSLNEKIVLKQFIDKVLKSEGNSLLDLILNDILWTSISKIQHYTCSEVQEGLKLQITGKIIPLSDINIDHCGTYLNYLEILAADKVIIKEDLDLTGREMHVTIIAPDWEIEGNRKIVLNGKNGENENKKKARDGTSEREKNGVDGFAGMPGGPAGSFHGVANRIHNGQQLSILANGGNGGNGQDGGHGANGTEGLGVKDPEKCLDGPAGYKHWQWVLPGWALIGFWNIGNRYFTKNGNPGTEGGNGGNGGVGGPGGYKGHVILLELSKNVSESSVKISTEQGNIGEQGNGGLPGKGGQYANMLKTTCFCHDLITCTFISNSPVPTVPIFAASGLTGMKGTSMKMSKVPETVPFHQNLSQSINEYKTYANSELLKYINRENELKVFRDLLNTLKEETQLLK